MGNVKNVNKHATVLVSSEGSKCSSWPLIDLFCRFSAGLGTGRPQRDEAQVEGLISFGKNGLYLSVIFKCGL